MLPAEILNVPQHFLLQIIKSKKEDGAAMAVLLPEEGHKERSYHLKVPSKHIIPAEAIIVNKELGVGEFGIVQQGVWTNEDGDRVIFNIHFQSSKLTIFYYHIRFKLQSNALVKRGCKIILWSF